MHFLHKKKTTFESWEGGLCFRTPLQERVLTHCQMPPLAKQSYNSFCLGPNKDNQKQSYMDKTLSGLSGLDLRPVQAHFSLSSSFWRFDGAASLSSGR
jgi:hypothetical protein